MNKKQIIPNEQNLLKALRACAKAHNAKLQIDCVEVGHKYFRNGIVNSDTLPTRCDIRSIVGAFAKNEPVEIIECSWGYITIYLPDIDYRDKVDEMALSLALPYGKRVRYATA
jgi:hypothetical protein